MPTAMTSEADPKLLDLYSDLFAHIPLRDINKVWTDACEVWLHYAQELEYTIRAHNDLVGLPKATGYDVACMNVVRAEARLDAAVDMLHGVLASIHPGAAASLDALRWRPSAKPLPSGEYEFPDIGQGHSLFRRIGDRL